MLAADESSEFLNNPPPNEVLKEDVVQSLLYEILRVKELIKCYEAIPNNGGDLGANILTELVAEAHKSLMNYDLELIHKYYDLLKHCD